MLPVNDCDNNIQTKQGIRILCLGDSLTAGTIAHGISEEPYSTFLADMLTAQGRKHDIVFVNAGINGDTVNDIQERLPVLLEQNTYHYLILLAGTNDLGAIMSLESDSADDAVAHISFNSIYSMLMAVPDLRGFLHLTVPYNTFDRLDANNKRVKDALNRRILLEKCPKKRVLDINDPTIGFNHLLMSEQDREMYWQDALHYTAEGYRRLAQSIHEGLLKMIGKH
ncbi:hypothetical protein BGX28_002994 [Mortierella sp. GBA30]|nr:hypothetical protein BGX28_002994 [Mortierella sp. GBA30]